MKTEVGVTRKYIITIPNFLGEIESEKRGEGKK
jgi:hypothetical protein